MVKDLKQMLKEIIPMIEGKWILHDGGALGLIRENKLIDGDKDLDIYLLPGTELNLPKESGYKLQDYYMDQKLYHRDNRPNYLNKWRQYCAYQRTLPKFKGISRAQLLHESSHTYYDMAKNPIFTNPYIDIYKLKQKNDTEYHIPEWDQTSCFKIEDCENPIINEDLGFTVPLINNTSAYLEKQYGSDWIHPDPEFSYMF